MNYINSFLMSVCAACVFIGALHILLPAGTLNKSIKFILSLTFLITVISAAGITIKNTDIDFKMPKSVENQAEKQLNLEAARYTYGYTLKRAGIEVSEILLFTDKSEDGSIHISKILVKTTAGAEAVKTALGEVAKNIRIEVVNE